MRAAESEVSIASLIRNGTLSAQIGAALWAAVEELRSFVVVAVPRLAGKTTLMNALLNLAPTGVPLHYLSGDKEEMARLKKAATGGYLVVGEISPAPIPTYLWGAPVRRVFDTLSSGYALAVALHASGLEEAFEVICQGNGVPDVEASRISYVLYVRRFGRSFDTLWRRLAEVHEVDRVVGGRPQGRLLYRWVEGEDRFEAGEKSRSLRASEADLERRAARLQELADSGRTSFADVSAMVAGHRRSR